MRILLILFLLTFSAFSANIVINNNDDSYTSFKIDFYQDKTEKLTFEQIQNIKDFNTIENNISVGKLSGNIWYHFTIENKTNINQKRTVFITEPSLHKLTIFILDKNGNTTSKSAGLAIINKEGKIARYSAQLEVELLAKNSKEIYIKSISPFHQTFQVIVPTQKDLVEYKILKASFLYFYFGAIAALLLYNLFIYFSIKDNIYLLYIGFVLLYAITQLEHNAIYPFNSFSSTKIAYSFSITHILWVAFHTFFSIKLLNIKEYFPRFAKYLLYIGYFILIVGFFGLYNLEMAIQIVHLFILVLPFVLLFTAGVLHLKKNELAIFYIIAQSLFLTSSLIFGLLYAGILEYTNFTRYIHLVGSFSEILLFSFALAYKTRLVIKENQKQKELVGEYSKLSFLGQTVINIYHQWKTPVNNIYNSINHIEIAKEFKDKDLNNIIEENLIQIKNNTQYLKNTSTSYLNYYKEIDQDKIKFSIKEELEAILKLHSQEFEKIKAHVMVECKKDYVLYLQKNIFTNILIILIENSINIFKQRHIKNPKINLIVNKECNNINIKILDNAGGIKLNKIDEIFEKNHSVSDSTGLGLFLLKDFLIPKIKGKIKVTNIKDGTCFILILSA